MIRRFHLFPGDTASFTFNLVPNEFRGHETFEYTVVGAIKGHETFPDRISIVKGRKQYTCSSCLTKMGEYGGLPPPKRFGILPYYYVGFVDSSCWIPRWGYEAKICMKCALKYLGDHSVYPCSVGKDFCEDVWDNVIFELSKEITVPFEKKTFEEYIREQFTVIETNKYDKRYELTRMRDE